jgi:hypothetical protein
MGLRELKELAHQQYVRGKFARCAQTYQQILRLAPRDPNMRVRHAEACRRAGERLQAIASYRAAAELLLELGCESRARGALKAALELDPRDALLQAEVARLEPQALCHEALSADDTEECELPLLPPLDSGVDPVPPPPPAAPRFGAGTHAANLRRTALPPIHRALPSVPSVTPLVPPVLLPAPDVPAMPALQPRPVTAGSQAHAARPATPPPLPPRSVTAGLQAAAARLEVAPLPPRTEMAGHPAPSTPAPASGSRAAPRAAQGVLLPPPPPVEAFCEGSPEEPSVIVAPELLAPEAAEASHPRVEIRRLSSNVLAFRCSPTDSWALIRSQAPLEMHLVEDLEKLPQVSCDFTLDITVEPSAESAPSPMQ